MKNSDPNYLQALYRVYYPPYVVPKTIGGVRRKSLACPLYLFKLALIFHCLPMLENCSKLGGQNEELRPKPSTGAVQGILPTLCSTQNDRRCTAQVIIVSVIPLQTCIIIASLSTA